MVDQTERKKWDPADNARGLECPECGCRHFHVDNTRKVSRMIIRYRRCRHCGRRMTTCERAVGQP
jgi:transcriptional regulator NrdR family protein